MNENCLEGLRCPNCGSYGPFHISVRTIALMDDDGTLDYEGAEWEDDSYCDCQECHHVATAGDFKDVDNDGRFKDCADCGETGNIDNMRLVDGSNIKGVWLCENCQDCRQATEKQVDGQDG
jgi:hypothetical protein